MLSNKAKYALKALVYLAREYGRGPVLIAELAEKERIPKKFLEQILLDFKVSGLLESKKGKGGGYQLARSPESITLGAIVRQADGPLAPVPCVSQTAYRRCEECEDETNCVVRLYMKDVRDAIADILDHTTLKDALERVEMTKGLSRSLMYHI